jgi:hypothetical protein
MGKNRGHQRGDSVAAYGELFMATVIPRCRGQAAGLDGGSTGLAPDVVAER